MAMLYNSVRTPAPAECGVSSRSNRSAERRTLLNLVKYSKRAKILSRNRGFGSRLFFGDFDCKLAFKDSARRDRSIAAALTEKFTPGKSSDSSATSFTTTFPLKRTVKVDGKIVAKVDSVKKDGKSRLVLECHIPGRWVLHWGVTYCEDPDSEWDQPPSHMLPPGSVSVKDYAVQTPLLQQTLPEAQRISYVQFDINDTDSIATIQFVLKDEDTGNWYKDDGKNFRVILDQAIQNDLYGINNHKALNMWPGILDHISGLFLKSNMSLPRDLENGSDIDDFNQSNQARGGVCKEYKLSKEEVVDHFLKVSVQENKEKKMNLVSFETDLPGDVVLHWGVCKDNTKQWEILLQDEYPSNTNIYRRRALQTPLQSKGNGSGSWAILCLDADYKGLLFVLKLKRDNTWLKHMGDDFYIPLTMENSWIVHSNKGYAFPLSDSGILDWTLKEQMELEKKKDELDKIHLLSASDTQSFEELKSLAGDQVSVVEANGKMDRKQRMDKDTQIDKLEDENKQFHVADERQSVSVVSNASEMENSFLEKEIGRNGYKDASSILLNKEIKILVERISAETTGSLETTTREQLLQEIERLAAIAYSSFKDSPSMLTEEPEPIVKVWKPQGKPCSGTGSGKEILLQCFNWESHRSGRWYHELADNAAKIASWGFTIVWLPPPTDSVSPEGYMPRDLYNLNSRYGSMDELKNVVRCFHDVGIKVLGDVVLNHRCAQYQNHNGIWNMFGGRLNWDDRAIVCDDPHFQGRGNKSSGDFFHAAPNIDHSQEFVRRDLNDWLLWLRNEIGYDGWRLDFVRGFWGGYVKDYLQGSEPYFAVGEYWDSLSYTYGQMDHNQDAHRQRIIDWINATGGNAGAFDVTTKGILHTALEKYEYWRLADQKRAPPGVVGWWPSRAVTFIENHDTGSTQGHWRFPAGKEIQGYAYILTHPGTPTVFYDHLFSHNCDGISALVALRKRAGIHCRSVVHIEKTEKDVYAAKIDDRVLVKIGPGHYQPSNNSSKWNLATEGQDYKVWEAS